MGKEIDKLTTAVKETFGAGFSVWSQAVEKNNGLVLQAVMVRETGNKAYTAIYVDQLLEEIESREIGLQDAACRIVNMYRNNQDGERLAEIVSNLNKKNILSCVTCQIINAEKNAGRLAGMPHKKFLDLAVIYKVSIGEENKYSITVTDEICRKYSISQKELHLSATQNMEKEGFTVQSLTSAISEITEVPEEIVSENYIPMFVLSNVSKLDGATVMLYEKYFSKLANQLGGDLYVIPSSIHEVLVVPCDGMDPDELRTTICFVNASEVSDDEILSGNVYRYSMEKNVFEIVKS